MHPTRHTETEYVIQLARNANLPNVLAAAEAFDTENETSNPSDRPFDPAVMEEINRIPEPSRDRVLRWFVFCHRYRVNRPNPWPKPEVNDDVVDGLLSDPDFNQFLEGIKREVKAEGDKTEREERGLDGFGPN
jgi:hypothetical protein